MVSQGRRPLARVVVLFGLWTVLVTAWSFAARELVPARQRRVWPAELARNAPPLARWDAGWYRTIVEQGYGPAPPAGVFSEHAFFPLYPAAVSLVTRATGADPFTAAVAVSIAALVAASFLFAGEGLRRAGATETMHAALLLLLFPTAFFLVAAYSESLFLLLALLAFREAARRRAPSAALAGILAGLTRPSALALALPLAIAWRSSPPPELAGPGRRRDLARALAVGAAPAVAALGWILALGIARGEPGLFFRVESVWQRGSGFAAFSFPGRETASASPSLALDTGSLVLFALIALHQARRRRWSDASWTAGAILLPLSTGTLMSLSRYLVVVYPAFFALAEVFRERPRLRLAWWVASGALLAAAVAAFVHWRWVA